MVFKLGKENMNGLIKKYPGSQLFDPSGKGRAMKDWVQVPTEFQGGLTSVSTGSGRLHFLAPVVLEFYARILTFNGHFIGLPFF